MLVIDRTIREIFCRKLTSQTFLKTAYAEKSAAPQLLVLRLHSCFLPQIIPDRIPFALASYAFAAGLSGPGIEPTVETEINPGVRMCCIVGHFSLLFVSSSAQCRLD